MNILLLASHQIAEYDDVRMFSDLGYDIFAPGGYENPDEPGERLRPALPAAPHHPELAALCDIQRTKHQEPPGRYIDWAKADLHPDLIDWADVIIVHHFVREWIAEQWPKIAHKRVIWRTCGQSDPSLELDMAPFHQDGLQIVRYSPAERRFFSSIGTFAGEDAMIRFGKYPDDYGSWTGDDAVVGNVTQHMVERGEATGLSFWLAATEGLPARPAGPGSERLPGGVGALSYDEMREYLRRCRAYLYTGTQPASYTLGLIEALMTGVPVVSIGKDAFGCGTLFEGDEISPWVARDPEAARAWLKATLERPVDGSAPLDEQYGRSPLSESKHIRQAAIDTFGIETIGREWVALLEGLTTSQVMQRLRIAV